MRFYGGTVSDWMAQPPWLVSIFIEQLRRIESEEMLQQMQVVGAGTGNMKEEHQKTVVRKLQRDARAGVPAKRASGAALSGMGIGVRKVE